MIRSRIIWGLCAIVVLGSNAFAGRVWCYSDVLNSQNLPIIGTDTAIGLRSGGAWPVVAYCMGGSPSGVAAMIPGAWAAGPVGFGGKYLSGATAPDGTVGFVDGWGTVAMLGKNGWSSSGLGMQSIYKNSIAFNNDSVAGVLGKNNNGELVLTMRTGSAWYGSTVKANNGNIIHSESYALDFDSYNQANIVFNDGGRLGYGMRGVLTSGQWQLSDYQNAPIIPNGSIGMVLSENDIPYVVYAGNSALNYAIYNRQNNAWATGVLDGYMADPLRANFSMATDSKGGVGVAYVADFAGQKMLSYAYNDGKGWALCDRLVNANYSYTVGLAFDYEDNPVISFVDAQTNYVRIAYDPVVPEPATLALLSAGLFFINRKK